MKLHQMNSLSKEGKYTIVTAPTGSGKTREIALLYLKKLAESAPKLTFNEETPTLTTLTLQKEEKTSE